MLLCHLTLAEPTMYLSMIGPDLLVVSVKCYAAPRGPGLVSSRCRATVKHAIGLCILVSQTKSLSLAQGGENSRQFGANSEQVAQLGHGRVATLPFHLYLHTVLMYVTKVMFSHRVGGKIENKLRLQVTELTGTSSVSSSTTETRHLVNTPGASGDGLCTSLHSTKLIQTN